jgi:hypothetical protein
MKNLLPLLASFVVGIAVFSSSVGATSHPLKLSYQFTTAEGDPFAGDWVRSTSQWVQWFSHSNPATSHIKFDQGVLGNRGFGQAWNTTKLNTSDFVVEFSMMYNNNTGIFRFGWVDEINHDTGRYATNANGWFVEVDSNLNNIRNYSMTNGSLSLINQTGAGWDRPVRDVRYNYVVTLEAGDGVTAPRLTVGWGGQADLVTTSASLGNAPTEGYFGFWRYHSTGGSTDFFLYNVDVAVIPEPANVGLMALSMLLLVMMVRRNRRHLPTA